MRKSRIILVCCLAIASSAVHFLAAQTVSAVDQTSRTALNQELDKAAAGFALQRSAIVAKIRTPADARARQAKVRAGLASLIGSFPERTPLDARVLGETKSDGFLIRKVIFESQPNFPVTALLYVPDMPSESGKHAAILLTPGHYPTGKAADARMAATFARNGFVTLSYDPIGQGERLQYPDPANPGKSLVTGATGEHAEASLQPMLIGDTFARYEIWDAMRGVDYLSSLPEVDTKRIGAFGCSGGGTVTALTAALDPRIAAIGVACYITSFNELLPAMGPQDAEQSTPRLLSSGFDFADLIEAAAPRPYAVISTYSDMFPFAGARNTVIEARRFYALFDPASTGQPSNNGAPAVPPAPDGPALNADTSNRVPLTARLQFITGPGHHAALQPITGRILSFFLRNLEPAADPDRPIVPDSAANDASAGVSLGLPKDAFQVTPTGQVATSFPHAETVFTLNQKRAALLLSARHAPNKQELPMLIRQATGAQATPGLSPSRTLPATNGAFTLPTTDGLELQADIAIPQQAGRHPAVLLLVPGSIHAEDPIAKTNKARFDALAAEGNLVLALTPRPSPPGAEEAKSPLLGGFYLLSLRADLVGRTLLGMRVDDVFQAVDFLASRSDVDPHKIVAEGSGHMGLVLLHAAALDPRLSHITVNHTVASYRGLLDASLPIDAPEDVVPGVLLHYDVPDLVRSLGSRVTIADPSKDDAGLSQTSAPISK